MDALIPHVRLTISDADVAAVTAVLRSGQVAMGPEVERLEEGIARIAQQKEAVALSSGTAALHLSLVALGVGSDDEVVLPAYACQALLNAVHQTGAQARLVDCDTTFNIDPAGIRRAIGVRTKAIIVPHMFGLMADMPRIRESAGMVPIVEDCAMGLGASLNGQPGGSFGDISVFSFYATKMVSGGEGGALASSRKDLIDIARDLREYDKKQTYRVRYNYKLSDIHAALALSQLERLPEFVEKRRSLAARYDASIDASRYILPVAPKGHEHSYARYVVRANDGDALRAYLKEHGIQAGKGVVFGLHNLESGHREFPASDEALRTAVSLPIYPSLTEPEQDRIIAALREYQSSV